MMGLSPATWIVLGLAAIFIGVSKTALPGLATLSVALFAAMLPAKESTAVMLILLMVGDVVAIWIFRHAADWGTLRRLIPPVVVGVICGAVFLHLANDLLMRRTIGWILLALTGLTLYLRHRRIRSRDHQRRHPPLFRAPVVARIGYGSLGGFTTMAANAGGPVMSLYFLWSRLPVVTFLGTTAWFFFLVNIIKLPFSATIGLIGVATLKLGGVLAPLVLIGALAGRRIISHLTQDTFEPLVIILTVISSAYLVC
ncbi:MAG: sulfite exporter TauE/SafE family protein [Actinomycetaceae bacterium]|nr:sulfite exporter TauE/SafE family protein [Actinomycetaceae bacterium]